MPQTQVIFYQDVDESVPVLDWLQNLQQKKPKAFAKCVARIRLLAEQGYDLRRPHADLLRDKIYELRIPLNKIQYRILYFFHGQNVAVLAHAITKEDKVPDVEIDRALKRKTLFIKNPDAHTYQEKIDGEEENR